MSVSTIDGTLTEAIKGRSREGKFTVFKSLTIQRDDGGLEVLKGQVTTAAIAEHLKPGASGRFYTYKAIDLKGVHGVRLKDGTSVHSYHKANLKIFPVTIVISVAWIVLMVLTRDAVPMLGVAVLIFSIFGFFFTRKSIAEAQAQFDGDDGVSVPPERTIARAV